MIKISFVVIGYNIQNYIEKCIKSILAQSLNDFEIVFVDDGSLDETLNKVISLQNTDDRIKVIHQKNSGANSARKRGFSAAKGKYILFVDGDDWIKDTLAFDIYKVAEKYESDIICFSYYYSYKDRNVKSEKKLYDNLTGLKYLELILAGNIPHEFWNKLYKREFLEKCNFDKIPNITMGDDLAANAMFGINKPNVKMINEAYYFYYQRENAVTKQSSPKSLEIASCLDYIEKILKENNLYEVYREEVDFLWFFHCYFFRVLIAPSYSKEVEKQIYKKWIQKKIYLKNNSYYNNFIKSKSTEMKLRKHVFDFNYNIGLIYLHIKNTIKRSGHSANSS